MSIDRAHRIGRPTAGKCRPIVVKFHSYKQRELVRKAAQDRVEALKAENQRVGVQQTKQMLQKRSQLYPIMDWERAAGKAVKWVGAKLFVQQQPGGRFQEITN